MITDHIYLVVIFKKDVASPLHRLTKYYINQGQNYSLQVSYPGTATKNRDEELPGMHITLMQYNHAQTHQNV